MENKIDHKTQLLIPNQVELADIFIVLLVVEEMIIFHVNTWYDNTLKIMNFQNRLEV